MAGSARFWRGLIKQNRFPGHDLNILVAGFAAYVLVRSLQREACSTFMIEKRRFPFQAVMTIGAFCHFACTGELRAVDVLMTQFAFGGSRLKVRIHQFRPHIRWFVAVNAGCPPMCAQQRKYRLRVIKAPEIPPRLRVMASLTTCARNLLHAIFELTLVRILVTSGAGAIFEAKNCCIVQQAGLVFRG